VPDLNLFRPLRRMAPPPLDGIASLPEMALDDWAGLRHGIPGNDLDDWDPDYIRRVLPLMSRLVNTYFRGEVRGLENIPDDGPVLLVGNHSGGTLIADTFVFACAFYEHFGPDRRFHQLAHDVAARLPGLGIRQWGTVAANHDNARKAFDLGAPVLVYPGGDHESFRPSWETDKIDFGGRKGFIKLALEQNVPIVPVVAIGGQETALFLGQGRKISRALRLENLTRIKVFPVQFAPPLGLTILDLPLRVPLPAKITVEVLPPVDLQERFGTEAEPEEIYDEVTGDMQDALTGLSDERTVPVLG
jgi:1-acyl-sn-glycerol-3-phosphate acyltransferase